MCARSWGWGIADAPAALRRDSRMLAKILFWIIVSLDVAALGLMFILGLAFAGPSHTYRMNVVGLMLVPAGVLAAALALSMNSPRGRNVRWSRQSSPGISKR